MRCACVESAVCTERVRVGSTSCIGVCVWGGEQGREVLSLPNPEGGRNVVKANILLLSTKQFIK